MIHRTKNLLLFVLILVCIFLTGSESLAQKTFERWFYPSNWAFSSQIASFDIHTAPDTGFVVVGQYGGYSFPRSTFVKRYSQFGDSLWEFGYGTIANQPAFPVVYDYQFSAIELCANGDWMVVGTVSDSSFQESAYVSRYSSAGTKIWAKRIAGPDLSHASNIYEYPNGEFLLVGSTVINGQYELFAARLSAQGNVLWGKGFLSGSFTKDLNSISTVDGGSILTMNTSIQNGADILTRLDSLGNVVWQREYVGVRPQFVQEFPNGNLVIGFSIDNIVNPGYGGGVAMLNASGVPIWSKRFSYFHVRDGRITGGNEVTICGSLFGVTGLIRVDSSGNLIWLRTYNSGSLFGSSGISMDVAQDDGFFLLGDFSVMQPVGIYGYRMLKTDSLAISNCGGTFLSDSVLSYTISTNPVTQTVINWGADTPLNESTTTYLSGWPDTLICANSCNLDAEFIASIPQVCIGDTVQFLNQSSNSQTYNWMLSANGPVLDSSFNFSWAPSSTGTYTIYLQANTAFCADLDSLSIQVISNLPLAPNLGPDTTICQGETVVLAPVIDSSASVLWSDNSSGNTMTVSHTGWYWIEYSNSCGTVWDSIFVEVVPIPAPVFGYTLTGLNAQFVDSTSGVNLNWFWTFGDGSVGSNLQSPNHLYGSNGTYTVCLTVDDQGCTDSLCQMITVTTVGLETEWEWEGEVYPNPNSGVFVVEGKQILGVRLYDAVGKIVWTGERVSRTSKVQVAVDGLADGIYFLRVSLAKGDVWRKVLVKQGSE